MVETNDILKSNEITHERVVEIFNKIPKGIKRHGNAGLIDLIISHLENRIVYEYINEIKLSHLIQSIDLVLQIECCALQSYASQIDNFAIKMVGNVQTISNLRRLIKSQFMYLKLLSAPTTSSHALSMIQTIEDPWEYKIMAFTGNPGVGKTTIVRELAEYFCGIGLVTKKTVIMRFGSDFKSPSELAQLYRDYLGHVIFIDEAYQMANSHAHEYADNLISAINDNKDEDNRTVFILAGYQKEMDLFLNKNPGIKRRLGNKLFHLDNYNDDELSKIFINKFKTCPLFNKSIESQALHEIIRQTPTEIKIRYNAGLIDHIIRIATEICLADLYDVEKEEISPLISLDQLQLASQSVNQ